MTPEIFADAIARISYSDGLVRFDLVRYLPPEDDGASDRPPRQELVQRVVMPMRGMLQGMATLQDLMRKLAEKGIVQRAGDAQGGVAVASAPSGAQGGNPPWSSNFPKS